jgi:hypothetical protein
LEGLNKAVEFSRRRSEEDIDLRNVEELQVDRRVFAATEGFFGAQTLTTAVGVPLMDASTEAVSEFTSSPAGTAVYAASVIIGTAATVYSDIERRRASRGIQRLETLRQKLDGAQ